MPPPIIQTPRGRIYHVTTAGGKLVAKLEWNTNFQPKWQKRYSDAQRFVDSEVLRLCEPYIPLLTGMLRDSGILGTFVGSGLVSWIAPYARRQYYATRKVGSQTGPLRGPFWFERWKKVGARKVIAEAKKIAGSGK